MSLINCPNCGRPNVSDSAEKCPECGYNIKAHFEEIKSVSHKQIFSIRKRNKPEIQTNEYKKSQKKGIFFHILPHKKLLRKIFGFFTLKIDESI